MAGRRLLSLTVCTVVSRCHLDLQEVHQRATLLLLLLQAHHEGRVLGPLGLVCSCCCRQCNRFTSCIVCCLVAAAACRFREGNLELHGSDDLHKLVLCEVRWDHGQLCVGLRCILARPPRDVAHGFAHPVDVHSICGRVVLCHIGCPHPGLCSVPVQ